MVWIVSVSPRLRVSPRIFIIISGRSLSSKSLVCATVAALVCATHIPGKNQLFKSLVCATVASLVCATLLVDSRSRTDSSCHDRWFVPRLHHLLPSSPALGCFLLKKGTGWMKAEYFFPYSSHENWCINFFIVLAYLMPRSFYRFDLFIFRPSFSRRWFVQGFLLNFGTRITTRSYVVNWWPHGRLFPNDRTHVNALCPI